MKILKLIIFFFVALLSAQERVLPFDSLKLKDVKDFFADDYGNIYLSKRKDFSFTKYDSLGRQKGKLLFTVPFVIQSVQNPLNIAAFSENAQELKFFDQNLNEIQTVNFRQKFGFVKMVYSEDLQQIWLLDESTKRLIQYNFRENKIISSYPIDLNLENIHDFLIFENKVYLLEREKFLVYNFKLEKLVEMPVQNAKRLRREGENILIIGQNYILKFQNNSLNEVFKAENAEIVEKNSIAYFVMTHNKLYLYPIEKKQKN